MLLSSSSLHLKLYVGNALRLWLSSFNGNGPAAFIDAIGLGSNTAQDTLISQTLTNDRKRLGKHLHRAEERRDTVAEIEIAWLSFLLSLFLHNSLRTVEQCHGFFREQFWAISSVFEKWALCLTFHSMECAMLCKGILFRGISPHRFLFLQNRSQTCTEGSILTGKEL